MAEGTSSGSGSNRGWQSQKSLLDCHKYMFDKELHSDVTFALQDHGRAVELRAHKYILICRSPVFEAMLTEPRFEESSHKVVVKDVEAPVFKEVLRYMYTDKVNLNQDNVFHVMYAAKKYLLENLATTCSKFLCRIAEVSNACTILNNAMSFEENHVVWTCLGIIAQYPEKVFESDDFFNLNEGSLRRVLECDGIALKSEYEIFHHCVRWARAKQETEARRTRTLRNILGCCFDQIRFTHMSSLEIDDVINTDPDMLTAKEQAQFFRASANPKRHRELLHEPRKSKSIQIDRFSSITESIEGFMKPSVSFRVNKLVVLDSLSVYCRIRGKTTCDVKVVVQRRIDTVTEVYHHDMEIKDNPSKVCVPVGVTIFPEIVHTIEAVFRAGQAPIFSVGGAGGRESITFEDVIVSFLPSQIQDDVNKGLIPNLHFTRIE